LIVAAPESCPALAADCVNFVYEDEARRVLAALFEHVAHATRADAHKHLHEIGAADREERHLRLPRYRFRQQRLSRTRRTNHKQPLGYPSAHTLESLRVLEKVDDLADLFLRFVASRHVCEGDPVLLAG